MFFPKLLPDWTDPPRKRPESRREDGEKPEFVVELDPQKNRERPVEMSWLFTSQGSPYLTLIGWSRLPSRKNGPPNTEPDPNASLSRFCYNSTHKEPMPHKRKESLNTSIM